MRLFAVAVVALALTACTRPPAANAPASPAPAAPSPAATTASATATVPSGALTALPFQYVLVPPPQPAGAPAILEVAVNDRVLHPGGPYIVRVLTTPDVTTITVEAMGGSYGLPADGPGRFFTSGSVPSGVPFFLINRSYTLTVVAQTADGRSTSFVVPMRLER